MRLIRAILSIAIVLTAAIALTACGADTEPATDITPYSAVLHADVSWKKGEDTVGWFRYWEKGNPDNYKDTEHVDYGEFGNPYTDWDLSTRVSGLKPDTTYQFYLCGRLQKPFKAGTEQKPVCYDDIEGAETQITEFTTDPAPVTNYTLSVSTSGDGSGSVTASGINCPGDCSQAYASGTNVTLTATPASGSDFAGWSGGGCSGASTSCALSMTQARSVTATFNKEPVGGSALVVPGTGAILGQDLGTVANPSNVWGAQDSPASEGYRSDGQNDPYIVRQTSGADPHIAVGQTQPSSYYWHVRADGKVSVGDLDRNPTHTRTQLQHMWFEGSVDHNQFDFAPEDKYVFYLSYRTEPGVHPEPIETHGGNSNHTQLFQFKNFGQGQGNSQSPPFAGYVGNNGIGFKTSDINEKKTFQDLRAPSGQWVRIAIVVNWTSNGWYEVWSDLKDRDSGQLDPSGQLHKVIPRQTGINFTEPGMTRVAWGIGLYHKLSLFDGTVSGHPKQSEVWTDYANAQMTAYNGS